MPPWTGPSTPASHRAPLGQARSWQRCPSALRRLQQLLRRPLLPPDALRLLPRRQSRTPGHGVTADPATVPDRVEPLRRSSGLQRLVLIGDRGMLTDARIEDLCQSPGPGLDLRSALRPPAQTGRRGDSSAQPLRRCQPSHHPLLAVPRRAAGGVLQPAAGTAAKSCCAAPGRSSSAFSARSGGGPASRSRPPRLP